MTIRKAGALIIRDRKLLVLKTRGKPFFLTPGGKYEGAETAEECLRRELQEELQITLKKFKYYKTYQFAVAAHQNKPLQLELYVVDYIGNPKASTEIEEIIWIDREEFWAKKYPLAPSFDAVIPDLIKDGLF